MERLILSLKVWWRFLRCKNNEARAIRLILNL